MKTEDTDILTGEILSSERLGSFMGSVYGLSDAGIPDSPSWIWQQLRWNPYLAMAVYEDLEEKDAKIASDLDTRKENVLSKSRRVLPASSKRQDVRLATLIEETLETYMDVSDGVRFGFDNVLWEALDGIAKGVAVGEIIYGEASDRIFIKNVMFQPQHLFSFGDGTLAPYTTYTRPQRGPLRLRPGIYGEGLSSETVLPARKFLVHTYRPRHGNRWGSPLLRKVFWPSWFKRASVKQWLRHLEKGSGSVVARYNDGAPPAEQQTALDAARAINDESAVAVPKKFLMEVMQHVRQSMGSAYSEMVDSFCNNEIARVIRGQTLTSRGSEGGGSRALGEVHERVEERKTEVDCKSLMLAINTQIVWPLTLFNAGPVARPPVWGINYEPGNDLNVMSEWMERLWKMHLPIPRAFVYNAYSVPEPGADEAVLDPPSSSEEQALPDSNSGGGKFSEKKSRPGASNDKSKTLPGLKMERFGRLRPSTMPRSAT